MEWLIGMCAFSVLSGRCFGSVLFFSRHDPSFRSVVFYPRYDRSFGPCILSFPSLPPSIPRPLRNSYPTQPDPTIFVAITSSKEPLPPHRKHPDQSSLVLRSDSRSPSSLRIHFQSLDLAPRRFSTCHCCPPPLSTLPQRLKWTKVGISRSFYTPSATNASLCTPVRHKQWSNSASLHRAVGHRRGRISRYRLALLLLSLVWTHTNTQFHGGPCVYRAHANLRKARRNRAEES